MAVYGYARVSTDKQVDGNSLEVQERQLQGWAMIRGCSLDRVFVEEGVSGSCHLQDRPQGQMLVSLLKSGDIIVATKLDRMFRSALDALQAMEQLSKRGVKLVLLDLGEVTDSTLGKLFLTIAAAFAEAERGRIAERIRASKSDAKARGCYLGGKVPFGYRVDPHRGLVKHSKEQAVLAELRELSGRISIRKARLFVMEKHGCQLSLATAAKAVAA